ncbi:DUF3048 domain-containing protein [Ardenticatena maritima]|uniref:DUF3048 domain-containing protein n=1 Tax=Ardenticatena maritima TaxID=872965 RepID=A0A0P6YUC2_9CHLR|nr:DUF3048 domain-containing protein [Ardenticatena maritima]KPL87225.1 hypothetical protein SE16_11990 [Ardenticatena maritima]
MRCLRCWIWLSVFAFLLMACGNSDSSEEGNQLSLAPTNTPPPEATATATPSPEPSPTPTPEPTPTPDYIANPPPRPTTPAQTVPETGRTYPPGMYEYIHTQFDVPHPPAPVPDEFVQSLPAPPDGVCPLTGVPVDDPAVLQRRPLNVRIDNSPQGRPQSGLAFADVVWETLAEGGITRFTATFLCQTPEVIGPVRSARLIDLQLWPMLDAILVHVGASQPVTDMILSSPWNRANIDEWLGHNAFYRIPADQAAVSWLRTYTSAARLWQFAESIGEQRPSRTLRGWQFDATPPDGGRPARTVIIPYSPGTSSVVTYRYDAESGRYLRYQGDTPHIDRTTGTQLSAATIFIVFADMTVTPIVEDSLGNKSLHFKVWGEGKGIVVRDGRAYDVTWRREGENVLIRPIAPDGSIFPFKPGPLWVQIVPTGMDVSLSE